MNTMSDDDAPLDFHIVRIEINASAVVQEPEGHVLGQNMVDATLAFGWRMAEPRKGLSDAEVNAGLTRALSPVIAIIQTALTFNGWILIGQVADADSIVKAGSRVVGTGVSLPVTVRVDFADEGNAVHD